MPKLEVPAPERIAPGRLRLVQELLNAAPEDPTAAQLSVAAEIRAAYANGEDPATLAARFALSRQLVSAIVRDKLLAGTAPSDDDTEAASVGSLSTATAWLHARRLLGPGETLDSMVHARLLELRALLRNLALANNGHEFDPGSLGRLDAIAQPLQLRVAFGPAGAKLEPPASVADAPLRHLVAIVYEAMRDGSWQRLKACPADGCTAVFYDVSKNRTATWCSMSICGNRAKVRSYQARRREPRK